MSQEQAASRNPSNVAIEDLTHLETILAPEQEQTGSNVTARTSGQCKKSDTKLAFTGPFGLAELPEALFGLRDVARSSTSLTLDFSNCSAAFAGPIAALNCEMDRLWASDLDTSLILPTTDKLRKLFVNANWAHLLAPNTHAPTTNWYNNHIPATRFRTGTEQCRLIESAIDTLLASASNLARSDLAAIEWALGEVTDNVLTHSRSDVGGIIQASTLTNQSAVEFVVCDSGVSIPTTLTKAYPSKTDQEYLELAIQEGVTCDTSVGQGNGLFGTFEICRISNGHLHLRSGVGNLYYDPSQGLRVTTEQARLEGTLLVCTINYSNADVLKDALKFRGKIVNPTDRLELAYEDDSSHFVLSVRAEAESTFSRRGASRFRQKLRNLIKMSPEGRAVRIDFAGIAVISSSFADEALAKLAAEIGMAQFDHAVRIENATDNIRHVLARSIAQRTSGSSKPASGW